MSQAWFLEMTGIEIFSAEEKEPEKWENNSKMLLLY
jgi:hypothetical protein